MAPFTFKTDTAWKSICHNKAIELVMIPDETVFIGVHGDGVPFSKSDSIEIISYNAINSPIHCYLEKNTSADVAKDVTHGTQSCQFLDGA